MARLCPFVRRELGWDVERVYATKEARPLAMIELKPARRLRLDFVLLSYLSLRVAWPRSVFVAERAVPPSVSRKAFWGRAFGRGVAERRSRRRLGSG